VVHEKHGKTVQITARYVGYPILTFYQNLKFNMPKTASARLACFRILPKRSVMDNEI